MLSWSLLIFSIPALVFLHLHVSPYTKVEESFNIQAVHDILTYGIPTKNVAETLKAQYDHMTYPGAVPRTFVGAFVLAGISKPFIWMNDELDRQYLVRALLGLFNALSLVVYATAVRKAFGKTAGVWYIVLQASQFHVIYYASRTLPNMFAFGLSTFALSLLLPGQTQDLRLKRTRLAIYLLCFAAVVFRSELALLLACHSIQLILHAPTFPSRKAVFHKILIPSGMLGTLTGLVLSVSIDTFFWQSPSPLWPELSAFISNVFPSTNGLGASAWGTSPWHWYFTSAMPRLFLNPLVLLAIPFSLSQSATAHASLRLLLPNVAYVILYSFLPHKETRFLFPILPPMTASAALGATYIFNRRKRSLLCLIANYALIFSSLLTCVISHGVLLKLSSSNYPGAEALASLQASAHNSKSTLKVHLDNLSLQTGVTRFLEVPRHAKNPAAFSGRSDGKTSPGQTTSSVWIYDKTDNATDLLNPFFWEKFDYAIMETPGLAIGSWKVIDRIDGLGSPRLLRPNEHRGPANPNEGVALVIACLGGPFPLVMAYKIFHEILREGWGFHWLFGERGWSWTGGWWVTVDWIEKLYVLKKAAPAGKFS